MSGTEVTSWEVDHPSGAPPLALRVGIAAPRSAYTGDTAWTENLTAAAACADLLIAEAYYYDNGSSLRGMGAAPPQVAAPAQKVGACAACQRFGRLSV